ncbi:girdin-like isoform X1 [Rhincodon typus]|uniref:girdin-like isoform X1 n=1 Tax=Rhincodon typus TaxID=259920 RepID=UPI0020307657|nr:girdin-like isoform X1 [Rhincodon typus]
MPLMITYSISIYRTSSINLQECPTKLCAQCEYLTKELKLAKNEDKMSIHQEQLECGRECLTAGRNAVQATETESQSTEIEEKDQQSKKIISKINQDTQENARIWKESKDSVEGLQQQSADLTKNHNNINLQFEKLLEEIEGFVKLSLKLENERNQTVCKLKMQTTEVKNLEMSSEYNRKLLLHLLRKNIYLRHDNQLKVNQLTVLIIELHHLRKTYQALSQNVDYPEDNSSADWINRLRIIKNTVEKFKTQQMKLKLLEEENKLLAQKSGCESLQNMEAKVLALQKDILKLTDLDAQTRLQQDHHKILLTDKAVLGLHSETMGRLAGCKKQAMLREKGEQAEAEVKLKSLYPFSVQKMATEDV